MVNPVAAIDRAARPGRSLPARLYTELQGIHIGHRCVAAGQAALDSTAQT
jgi:hypothetical protein